MNYTIKYPKRQSKDSHLYLGRFRVALHRVGKIGMGVCRRVNRTKGPCAGRFRGLRKPLSRRGILTGGWRARRIYGAKAAPTLCSPSADLSPSEPKPVNTKDKLARKLAFHGARECTRPLSAAVLPRPRVKLTPIFTQNYPTGLARATLAMG